MKYWSFFTTILHYSVIKDFGCGWIIKDKQRDRKLIKKYIFQGKYSRFIIFPILLAIFIFTFSVLFQTSGITAAEKLVSSGNINDHEKTIIVVRSQQILAYNEAIKGFEEGCRGKDISIEEIYDLKGDTEEGKRIIQSIKNGKLKPDLILAVGVLAAILVKEQFTDIPIIFCMVINYERFNLQGNNITGISSEAPIEDQFSVFQEILSNHKNIGVIYDPAKTGEIISKATNTSKKLGFNLVKAEVASESEVAPALKGIVEKIHALWIIPDSTVITKESLDIILKVTQKHRLPTFCTSSAIVKAGAFISVSPDYTHTGIQASQMAEVLINNPKVMSLGMRQPDKSKLTLNTEIAKIIGVSLLPFQSRSDVVLYP